MLINDLWDKISSENTGFIISLYERWQEENQYEDINEYLKVIQKVIPQTYAITKRPFGIKIKCDDKNLKVDIVAKDDYIILRGKPIK